MALVTAANLAHPIGATPFSAGTERVQFPFELLANAIYFPVLVNGGGPYLFALDTGSYNSIVAAEVSSELGIKTGAAYRAVGAGSDSSPAATIDTLDLGLAQGITLTTKQAGVVSMAGLWPLIGKRFYGDVGHDILQAFVVEINYGKQLITLHDPASYHYTGSGTTLATHLFAGYDPQIDGELVVDGQRPIPVRFTVDTGGGGTIVSAPLVAKHHLIETVARTYATQDVGIGGAKPSEVVARLAALSIGPYGIDRPVVALSQDKSGSLSSQAISVNLGGNILRRFTIIIDYLHNTLTFEPNEHFAEPYDYDASGLLLTATGTNFRTFRVDSVLVGTPAQAAGLRKGDRIIAIDGRSVDAYALWQIEDALKRAGSSLSLTIRRGNTTIFKSIKLKALV
jgi:hypothetical protein